MNDVERALRDLGERVDRDVSYRAVPAARIVRRVRLRRALVVGGTAVAVLAAAVVFPRIEWGTDGGPQPVAVGLLESAAAATEDAGTARVEFTMAMDFAGSSSTTRGIGVADFDRETWRMRADLSGPFGEAVVEMISAGDDVYQRIVEPADVATEQWHRIDVDMPSGPAAALGSLGSDPAEMLSALRTISEEVVRVGDEELDGVPVTHYRATIDPGVFRGAGPQGIEVEMRPMDVWVDTTGRVRKQTWSMTTENAASGSSGSVRMTLRLWDFGTPVDVEAPPPSAVTDAPLPGSIFGPETSAGESSSGSTAGRSAGGDWVSVVGEAGLSGPSLIITRGEFNDGLCIQGLHRSTTRAALVDAATGDPLATFDEEDLAPSKSHHESAGSCMFPYEDQDVVDRLATHPEEFALRVERGGRPPRVIELTTAITSAD